MLLSKAERLRKPSFPELWLIKIAYPLPLYHSFLSDSSWSYMDIYIQTETWAANLILKPEVAAVTDLVIISHLCLIKRASLPPSSLHSPRWKELSLNSEIFFSSWRSVSSPFYSRPNAIATFRIVREDLEISEPLWWDPKCANVLTVWIDMLL